MVLLGTAYNLLRHFNFTPSQLEAASRAGIRDILPLTVLNWRKSRRRIPAPGFKMMYRSVLLGGKFRVRATLSLQRAIDRAGGFDRYIYYTPREDLRSSLAVSLKQRMERLVAQHPVLEPPPLDKRNPKPLPKKLPVNIKPVEVCDCKKYVYLG